MIKFHALHHLQQATMLNPENVIAASHYIGLLRQMMPEISEPGNEYEKKSQEVMKYYVDRGVFSNLYQYPSSFEKEVNATQ